MPPQPGIVRFFRRAGVWVVGAALASSAAAASWVHDQSRLTLLGNQDISSKLVANDFVVTSSVRLASADVWLGDDEIDDDGILDSFDGTLSWAVYTNQAGAPDTLTRSGTAEALVLTDTGLQDEDAYDVFKAHFELDLPLTLAPGTYWFVIHEGNWAQAFDDTTVYWEKGATVSGSPSAEANDETNPGSWITSVATDNAFVLYGTPHVWDQPGVFEGAGGYLVTGYAVACDFVVPAATSFSSVDAWIFDLVADDDGVVGDFSGTMGWAIYENGANVPGTFVASGHDPAVGVVDTGFQSNDGADVGRARIALGRTFSLAAGTYWLALHEGPWLSGGDGSAIYWAGAYQNAGQSSYMGVGTAPVWDIGPLGDPAVVVFDALLFASGFEAGASCAWSAGGVCP